MGFKSEFPKTSKSQDSIRLRGGESELQLKLIATALITDNCTDARPPP